MIKRNLLKRFIALSLICLMLPFAACNNAPSGDVAIEDENAEETLENITENEETRVSETETDT